MSNGSIWSLPDQALSVRLFTIPDSCCPVSTFSGCVVEKSSLAIHKSLFEVCVLSLLLNQCVPCHSLCFLFGGLIAEQLSFGFFPYLVLSCLKFKECKSVLLSIKLFLASMNTNGCLTTVNSDALYTCFFLLKHVCGKNSLHHSFR